MAASDLNLADIIAAIIAAPEEQRQLLWRELSAARLVDEAATQLAALEAAVGFSTLPVIENLASAEVALQSGMPYEYTPAVRGGTPPYTFDAPQTNYFGAIPAGLTFNTGDGSVTGAPATSGGAFLGRVTDSAGRQTHYLIGSPYADVVAASQAFLAQYDAENPPLRALPALPLPTGARVMELGHHEIGLGRYIAGLISNWSYGSITWVRFWDKRFNVDSPYMALEPLGRNGGSITYEFPRSGYGASNQGSEAETLSGRLPGVPALNTLGILNRLSTITALTPDIIYLAIGENDIQGGRSAIDIVTDLDRLLGFLVWSGSHVVIRTIQPSWPKWTAEQRYVRDTVNNWILRQTNRAGVRVADMSPVWTSPGIALQQRVLPAYIGGAPYWDALNPYGAHRAATALLPILQSMVTAGNFVSQDPSVGNFLTNWQNTGTTGTKNTGVTGNVPTSWSLTRLSGTATAVASLAQIGTSGTYQLVIDFTATDKTDARFRLGQAIKTFTTLGLAIGDWVQLMVPIKTDGWLGFSEVRAKIDFRNAANGNSRAALASTIVKRASFETGEQLNVGAVDGTAITEPTVILDGFDLVNIRLTELVDIYIGGAKGSGRLTFGPMTLREVNNPKPAWGLAAHA